MKTLDVTRRGITPAIRKQILDGNACCVYCGYAATEVDHIVPRSRGGGLDPENLAPACYECNHEKRDYTPDEWEKVRTAEGKPWPIPSYDARMLYLFRNGFFPQDMQLWESQHQSEWTNQNFARIRKALMDLRNGWHGL